MEPEDFVEENALQMYEAILKLRDISECQKLFKAMCTKKELSTIAQRYAVARMLDHDKTYKDIVETTGASTATISRVKRSLETEGEGYEIVFDRLDETRGRKKKNP